MRSQPSAGRWASALLIVLAVVFAPAPDDEALGIVRGPEDSAAARILAPAARPGMLATNPKHSTQHLEIADSGSRSVPLALVAAFAAAVLLLFSRTRSARGSSLAARRVIALRVRVPRGPPALHVV